jgi:Tol biopolymer transport system component
MNANGGHRHRLTRSWHGACWSPDGGTIAYERDNHVYVVSATGGRPRNLTPGHVYARGPDWSPDGRRIAFSEEGDLWVMSANGSHQHAITSSASFDEEQPAWSPDGRWISYIRTGADSTGVDGFELYLIRLDGTSRRPIAEAGSTDENPSWQPR